MLVMTFLSYSGVIPNAIVTKDYNIQTKLNPIVPPVFKCCPKVIHGKIPILNVVFWNFTTIINKITKPFTLTWISFHLFYVWLVSWLIGFYGISNHVGLCSLCWDCRIPQLRLCRGVGLASNECPGYDTKQSDGETPVMLELWAMWNSPFIAITLRSTLVRNVSTW